MDNSEPEKKIVQQKKSKIFTRVELGNPFGYVKETELIKQGFNSTFTIGYSIGKKARVGIGSGLLWFENWYVPVFANFEIGDHTKRVSPSFDINAGYAFTIPKDYFTEYSKPDNGLLIELLPSLSFGSYRYKSRYRISLGNQLQTTSYSQVYFLHFASNDLNNFVPRGWTPNHYKVLRINVLLKFGMDF